MPRPSKETAANVHENGVWQTIDLTIARQNLLRARLAEMQTPDPDLISYWIGCAERRESDFIARSVAAVHSISSLAPWVNKLQRDSDAMAAEGLQAERISNGYFSLDDSVNDRLRRALDLQGKRRALAETLSGLLAAAGPLDPQKNQAGKPLYLFLRESLDSKLEAELRDRAGRLGPLHELRRDFLDSIKAPALSPSFDSLERLEKSLETLKTDLLEKALTPTQEPSRYLAEDVTKRYADVRLAMDRELVRVLDSPTFKEDPDNARVLNGVFPVWETMDRYHAYLQAGRRVYGISALMTVAQTVLLSESWQSEAIDSETGAAFSDLLTQRAGHLLDLLNSFQMDLQRPGTHPDPLYAAVALELPRRRMPYAWIGWQWLTMGDLDDLNIDGRIVEGAGTRWLLPAGSAVRTITGREEAAAARASAVIVSLDFAAIWPEEKIQSP